MSLRNRRRTVAPAQVVPASPSCCDPAILAMCMFPLGYERVAIEMGHPQAGRGEDPAEPTVRDDVPIAQWAGLEHDRRLGRTRHEV